MWHYVRSLEPGDTVLIKSRITFSSRVRQKILRWNSNVHRTLLGLCLACFLLMGVKCRPNKRWPCFYWFRPVFFFLFLRVWFLKSGGTFINAGVFNMIIIKRILVWSDILVWQEKITGRRFRGIYIVSSMVEICEFCNVIFGWPNGEKPDGFP